MGARPLRQRRYVQAAARVCASSAPFVASRSLRRRRSAFGWLRWGVLGRELVQLFVDAWRDLAAIGWGIEDAVAIVLLVAVAQWSWEWFPLALLLAVAFTTRSAPLTHGGGPA